MIKTKVLSLLKQHQREPARYHVKSLYLFGSVARDEEKPQSDIDILVAFDVPPTFKLPLYGS